MEPTSREARTLEQLHLLATSAEFTNAKLYIHERHFWRALSNWMQLIAQILAVITSVLTFTASSELYSKNMWLSFIAGLIGVAGVAVSGFSYYAWPESNERMGKLNDILKKYNSLLYP